MARNGWISLRVEDVEAVPWRGTELVWHPLRAALGLHAFGAGAYTADRVGQVIVEPHAELDHGRGHEEVYVVLEGRVAFTLDDETIDAPAGTCVCVRPETHRLGMAVEIPATVVAFGREPDFAVSGEEWIDRVRPFLKSDRAHCRKVIDEGALELPDSPAIGYGLALVAAAEGHAEEAREGLREAVRRDPRLRVLRELDPELWALLDEPADAPQAG
jgi:mannose-6-phosphate isomerase-like protein (cupin superfamily)